MILWMMVLMVAATLVFVQIVNLPTDRGFKLGFLIMNLFTKEIRVGRSGLAWIWLWEKVVPDSQTSLQKRSYSEHTDFEIKKDPSKKGQNQENEKDEPTKDEKVQLSVLPIDWRFEVVPRLEKLLAYRSFDTDERIAGMKDKLKSIIGVILQRECKDREDLMGMKDPNNPNSVSMLEHIASSAKADFEKATIKMPPVVIDGKEEEILPVKLEDYYGIDLQNVFLADPSLPPVLQEAAVKREAQVEQNKTRDLEMAKLREMAQALVKESGNQMPFENAMQIVQMQFGSNVKKNIQIFGLDKGTQIALQEIIKEVFHGARKA